MRRWPLHKRILLRLVRSFRPVTNVRYHGHVLTIDTRDLYIGGELFLGGTWQEHLTALIGRLGLEGKVAVDAGANIGAFTVIMSDAVGARGRVIAIEPEPHVAALLAVNVSRLPGNAAVFQVAAGEAEGEASMQTSRRNFGDNRIVSRAPAEHRGVRVPVTTVDALTAPFPDGAVGLMKVDVQGFERQVVAGARETLRRNPDLILMIEVEDEAARELFAGLWGAGWRGWEMTASGASRLEGPAPASGTCDLVLSRTAAGQSRIESAVNAAR